MEFQASRPEVGRLQFALQIGRSGDQTSHFGELQTEVFGCTAQRLEILGPGIDGEIHRGRWRRKPDLRRIAGPGELDITSEFDLLPDLRVESDGLGTDGHTERELARDPQKRSRPHRIDAQTRSAARGPGLHGDIRRRTSFLAVRELETELCVSE